MATSDEFIEKIVRVCAGAGVSCRKMFGEYAVYCGGRLYAYACDDRFLVKVTQAARELLPDAPLELPYPGAKPLLRVTDVENAPLMRALAVRVSAEVPPPKKRGR